MKYHIYSIYDTCTEAYMRPFYSPTDAAAYRQFESLVSDETHEVSIHAEHYGLFKIGTFTDNNGVIEDVENVCIARAHEIKAQLNQNVHKISKEA